MFHTGARILPPPPIFFSGGGGGNLRIFSKLSRTRLDVDVLLVEFYHRFMYIAPSSDYSLLSLILTNNKRQKAISRV